MHFTYKTHVHLFCIWEHKYPPGTFKENPTYSWLLGYKKTKQPTPNEISKDKGACKHLNGSEQRKTNITQNSNFELERASTVAVISPTSSTMYGPQNKAWALQADPQIKAKPSNVMFQSSISIWKEISIYIDLYIYKYISLYIDRYL